MKLPERSTAIRVAAGLAVVVALVAALRTWILEPVEVDSPVAVSPEARADPYLALGLLLEEGGLDAEGRHGLGTLPETDRTVWWLAPTRRIGPTRLLDWVASGGHLVLAPLGEEDEEDRILAQLGTTLFTEDMADEDDHISRSAFASDRAEWPRLWAHHDDVEIVRADGAEDAAWILTVRHGDGLATILTGSDFLRNDALAEKDHARIAWWIATGIAAEARGHLLVVRDPPPSVWAFLGPHTVPVGISLGLLALAAVLFLARRAGPILPSSPPDRRHLAEHVRATGRFLWNQDRSDVLLEAVRRAAPLPTAQPELERLLERTGVDAARFRAARTDRDVEDRDLFLRHVRLLERLRRSGELVPPSDRPTLE